jgi:hypothetical protein
VGYFASGLFFCGLLVTLGMILEAMMSAEWPRMRAALRAPSFGPSFRAAVPRPRARPSAAA